MEADAPIRSHHGRTASADANANANAAAPPPPVRRPGRLARRAARRARTLGTVALGVSAGLAVALAPGCGRTMVDDLAPWAGSFNPPTTMPDGGPGPDTVTDDRVVVVGHFEPPPFSSVEWPGIGADMADAVARTLLNRSRLNVLVNPRLAADVARLREQPDESRLAALQAIRRSHPSVRLVVNGRITDFLHSEDVDRSLRRRTAVFTRSREAVVALQLDVFDLELGRTVATDHLVGAADAPKREVADLYRNVSFDTAFFWSTPLGKASRETILSAVDVLDRMVPAAGPQVVVASRTGRELELFVASGRPLRRGQRLFLYERADDGSLLAVRDPASGQQLRAHVQSDGRSKVTALLFGLPADGVDMRGMQLLPMSAREGGPGDARVGMAGG